MRSILACSVVLFSALVLFVWPGAAQAQWAGFYTSTQKDPEPVTRHRELAVSNSGVCIREILLAQLRHRIPGNLLLGIGLQEAGLYRGGELTIWPWTANAEGEGHYFDTAKEAVDWVSAQQIDGVRSIDVGCMQVNMHWHPDAFDGVGDGFDPARNVDYAASYLNSLYEKSGDWSVAAGSYHSGTAELQKKYLERLEQNIAVANARIEDFRQMAGEARQFAEYQPKVAPAAPRAAMPTTGVFWTAWLGREEHEESGGRSLFGPDRISPILPDLRKTF